MPTEDWNDLFLRTDTRETGTSPRFGGVGSPDIIPAGTSPVDPSQYTTGESYKAYYNTNFIQNQANYVYVRAKNSSTSPTPKKGEVHVGLTDPAIVLWPGGDKWTYLKNSSGKEASLIEGVAGGKIGVTTNAFQYVPTATGHRCLVSWISTPDHPIVGPPPLIRTMEELATFLIDHPNYAHHNIDIAPDTTGAVTTIKPYTQGNQGAKVVFGMRCYNVKGFEVGFSCGKPLKDGSRIELKPTTVAQDDVITYTIDRNVEADFAADIAITYVTHGLKPAEYSVTFVAYYDTPPGHPLYRFATPYQQMGVPASLKGPDARGIQVGSIGKMKGSVQS